MAEQGNRKILIKSEEKKVNIQKKRSNIPRAPRIQDLTVSDMRYWEEDIARYRADKKGYTYAKNKNNYYAELKGAEKEIKIALDGTDGKRKR